jgi:PAS domain S-box-containing protein
MTPTEQEEDELAPTSSSHPSTGETGYEKALPSTAVLQNEEHFRIAAENALVGIYIIQDDRFRYVNPALAHFLGYEPEQLIDTVSPFDLIDPADRPRVADRMRARLDGTAGHEPSHFCALRRDGSRIRIESLGRAALFQGRQAVIGTLLDVTERYEAAAQIEQRNRELQTLLSVSQRLVGEFGLQERLQAITDAIVSTTAAADAASLWLRDGDDHDDQLTLHAWSGYAEEEVAHLRAPSEAALARLVSQAGQPRLVTGRNVATGQHGDDKHTALGVPILLQGELLGALLVDSYARGRGFDQHDLRLFQSVAAEAAIAIRNVQLLAATQQHRQELQRLAQRLLTVREAEARRISRLLHDITGQTLTAVSINLAEVERVMPPGTDPIVAERLQESKALLAETLDQVRELSLELRPTMLDDLGLLPTLRWYMHRFGRRFGIDTTLATTGPISCVEPEVESILYRIFQEALTNVARHARATSVHVSLGCDQQNLHITVEDDGAGFDVSRLSAENSRLRAGLIGMRERVSLLDGTLRIVSAPGQGTRLFVQLPCPPQTPSAPSGAR